MYKASDFLVGHNYHAASINSGRAVFDPSTTPTPRTCQWKWMVKEVKDYVKIIKFVQMCILRLEPFVVQCFFSSSLQLLLQLRGSRSQHAVTAAPWAPEPLPNVGHESVFIFFFQLFMEAPWNLWFSSRRNRFLQCKQTMLALGLITSTKQTGSLPHVPTPPCTNI